VSVAIADSAENDDDDSAVDGEKVMTLDERQRHELKCHEVFLSRQVETLPATHIRGKCSVTLLSEAESPLAYLKHDVCTQFLSYVCSYRICVCLDNYDSVLLQGNSRLKNYAFK